jgi:GT2 family glycosyltransferase
VTFAEVTVVIPTIGRPSLLAQTLNSLAACEPQPAEVLVVDQSDQLATVPITENAVLSARTIASRGNGRGLACNEGLEQAAHQVVLMVDDDCTVRPDWVGVAHRAMLDEPDGIITGQVRPAGAGDPRTVPSTIVMEEPRDYTGQVQHGVLFAGNMACSREAILDLGGFDERILPAAEDCDLCYRWLRAGRPLRYLPELVVWHHEWRSPKDLNRHYVNYYRGSGMFYAKHLLARDLTMLRFLGVDCYGALRSLYSGLFRGVPRWADYRRGVFAGLPRGLWTGWREFHAQSRRTRTELRPR